METIATFYAADMTVLGTATKVFNYKRSSQRAAAHHRWMDAEIKRFPSATRCLLTEKAWNGDIETRFLIQNGRTQIGPGYGSRWE